MQFVPGLPTTVTLPVTQSLLGIIIAIGSSDAGLAKTTHFTKRKLEWNLEAHLTKRKLEWNFEVALHSQLSMTFHFSMVMIQLLINDMQLNCHSFIYCRAPS